MKLAMLVLGISVLSTAAAGDSITLTQGTASIKGLFSHLDSYSLNMYGPGVSLLDLVPFEASLTPGIFQCGSCFGVEVGMILLSLHSGPGTGVLNGPGITGTTWISSGIFEAETVRSTLLPSGDLLVSGIAKPSGDLTVCAADSLEGTCLRTDQVFVLGGDWRYRAVFSPNHDAAGSFFFSSLEMATVPEPGTLILVGSGLLAAWMRRKTL